MTRNDDERDFPECVRIIAEHYGTRRPRAELVANLLLGMRNYLRNQDPPRSLERMSVHEIIEVVDEAFPN